MNSSKQGTKSIIKARLSSQNKTHQTIPLSNNANSPFSNLFRFYSVFHLPSTIGHITQIKFDKTQSCQLCLFILPPTFLSTLHNTTPCYT